jgi:hypothetical protein
MAAPYLFHPNPKNTMNRRYQRHRRWCAKVAKDPTFHSLEKRTRNRAPGQFTLPGTSPK